MVDETMFDDVTPPVMSEQVRKAIAKYQTLRLAVVKAEAAFKKATAEYEKFAREDLVNEFGNAGLAAVMMDDGSIISIENVTRCSLNKNPADKENVVKWLREHDAGNLVKSECIVPATRIQELRMASIPFKEDVSINTNSVKAFLLDALGQKGAPATISVEDIPKGIGWFQYKEATVKEAK